MIKHSYLLIAVLVVLSIISACSNASKTPVVVEAPVSPMIIAQAHADSALDAFDAEEYQNALSQFNFALNTFREASAIATEIDSVNHKIEKMQLNIATTQIRMANESYEAQIYTEAIEHYEAALGVYDSITTPITIEAETLQQNKVQLYGNLALVNRNAGDFEAAITYYDRILAGDPNNAEILNSKFMVLNNDIRDTERAFRVLRDYAEASNDANAYLMLASKYAESGNNTEAQNYYTRALEIRADGNTYRSLANFYRSTSQWANSNDILLRYVGTNPAQEELLICYRLLGDNYRNLNNNAKMVEYFEKALLIEDDSQLALAVASYYNGRSNWAKVISFATVALRGNARNADALLLRGNAYYRSNRFNEARTDLELIRNDPRHGTNATNLLNAIARRRG